MFFGKCWGIPEFMRIPRNFPQKMDVIGNVGACDTKDTQVAGHVLQDVLFLNETEHQDITKTQILRGSEGQKIAAKRR